MKDVQIERIKRFIQELENTDGVSSGFYAEKLFTKILNPLLKEDGYDFSDTGSKTDMGIDAIAINNQEPSERHNIAIEFKFYKSKNPVPRHVIENFINIGLRSGYGKLMLVSNRNFSKQSRFFFDENFPVGLELIDLNALKAWVSRYELSKISNLSEIQLILKSTSQQFIEIIAKNPSALNELEWRDVERIVSELFAGLGFKSTLTPPSKDGGKDVILECTISNERKTYVVEIKHWRSSIKVGGSSLKGFLNVILNEKRQGGLFLSTYGFCNNAFQQLTQLERKIVKFGEENKIISLAKRYTKMRSGLWQPDDKLEELLFEDTQ